MMTVTLNLSGDDSWATVMRLADALHDYRVGIGDTGLRTSGSH
jgi:hypothetical protein